MSDSRNKKINQLKQLIEDPLIKHISTNINDVRQYADGAIAGAHLAAKFSDLTIEFDQLSNNQTMDPILLGDKFKILLQKFGELLIETQQEQVKTKKLYAVRMVKNNIERMTEQCKRALEQAKETYPSSLIGKNKEFLAQETRIETLRKNAIDSLNDMAKKASGEKPLSVSGEFFSPFDTFINQQKTRLINQTVFKDPYFNRVKEDINVLVSFAPKDTQEQVRQELNEELRQIVGSITHKTELRLLKTHHENLEAQINFARNKAAAVPVTIHARRNSGSGFFDKTARGNQQQAQGGFEIDSKPEPRPRSSNKGKGPG
ncbi:MAG TPA: hypothetical protein VLJ15_03335 [Gammaproteobacteria bacterium]|nr:hypothetical protein [Gammaproteobacteria bacterium]